MVEALTTDGIRRNKTVGNHQRKKEETLTLIHFKYLVHPALANSFPIIPKSPEDLRGRKLDEIL